MTESSSRVLFWVMVGVLILAVPAVVLAADDAVPRITKEEAKTVLGNSDVIFIDVRLPHDWDSSESKIQGAVRVDPADVATWAEKFPKNKTLIIYCA